MAANHYALETNGKNRLDVSWKGILYGGKEVTVSLDGSVIGIIPDKVAFSAGQEFPLPDASTVRVQLIKGVVNVSRNGQLLHDSWLNPQPQPKSAAQQATNYQIAYFMVYFVGGLTLVLGLASALFNFDLLGQNTGGLYQIPFGLVFLVLGFFVQRRSLTALIVAIAIYGLDGFVALLSLISGGSFLAFAILFSRIVFITPMIRGVGAIRAARRPE